MRTLVLCSLVLASRTALGADPAPAPLASLSADATFIDDTFALDAEGKRLAVVRTDGADVCRLEVLELPGLTKVMTADLAPLSKNPERLLFSPDGRRVVVVGLVPGSTPPQRVAQSFDLGGGQSKAQVSPCSACGRKAGKKLGPASDFALAMVGGKPRLISFHQRIEEGGNTYVVAAYALEDGKPAGTKTLKVGAGGTLAGKADLKPIAWQDGYTSLLVQQKGGYDKKADAERPDTAGTFDVLRGRVSATREIKDLVTWVRTAPLRIDRPNQLTFLLVAEDLKGLELLRKDDTRAPIALARAFKHYDQDSLRQRLWPETGAPKQLWFSLSVDPVNTEAVSQKTYFPDDFDVYVIDLEAATPAARRVLSLPGDKRERRSAVFAAGGGKVAVLRKHKTLDRGGNELRVYESKLVYSFRPK
jgi:hypothetical protein